MPTGSFIEIWNLRIFWLTVGRSWTSNWQISVSLEPTTIQSRSIPMKSSLYGTELQKCCWALKFTTLLLISGLWDAFSMKSRIKEFSFVGIPKLTRFSKYSRSWELQAKVYGKMWRNWRISNPLSPNGEADSLTNFVPRSQRTESIW